MFMSQKCDKTNFRSKIVFFSTFIHCIQSLVYTSLIFYQVRKIVLTLSLVVFTFAICLDVLVSIMD